MSTDPISGILPVPSLHGCGRCSAPAEAGPDGLPPVACVRCVPGAPTTIPGVYHIHSFRRALWHTVDLRGGHPTCSGCSRWHGAGACKHSDHVALLAFWGWPTVALHSPIIAQRWGPARPEED